METSDKVEKPDLEKSFQALKAIIDDDGSGNEEDLFTIDFVGKQETVAGQATFFRGPTGAILVKGPIVEFFFQREFSLFDDFKTLCEEKGWHFLLPTAGLESSDNTTALDLVALTQGAVDELLAVLPRARGKGKSFTREFLAGESPTLALEGTTLVKGLSKVKARIALSGVQAKVGNIVLLAGKKQGRTEPFLNCFDTNGQPLSTRVEDYTWEVDAAAWQLVQQSESTAKASKKEFLDESCEVQRIGGKALAANLNNIKTIVGGINLLGRAGDIFIKATKRQREDVKIETYNAAGEAVECDIAAQDWDLEVAVWNKVKAGQKKQRLVGSDLPVPRPTEKTSLPVPQKTSRRTTSKMADPAVLKAQKAQADVENQRKLTHKKRQATMRENARGNLLTEIDKAKGNAAKLNQIKLRLEDSIEGLLKQGAGKPLPLIQLSKSNVLPPNTAVTDLDNIGEALKPCLTIELQAPSPRKPEDLKANPDLLERKDVLALVKSLQTKLVKIPRGFKLLQIIVQLPAVKGRSGGRFELERIDLTKRSKQ